ncbi:MAG: class I SAM-dependent methyltransferase [Acidimicrobiia bacterium]|nr:class I SAM-dependent methyltransferase [Acidimicrobiia bacterium]
MYRFALVSMFVALVAAVAQAQQPGAKPPDHMQHRFDDPAKFAKSFDDPKRDAWQMPDRVIAALKLAPNAAVADIGAGTGYFSMRLARAVPKGTVYAVDIEPNMISHLKTRAATEKRTNVTPVLASAESPNLTQPVDVILIVDTYHHIGSRKAYFQALRSKLKPGGRIAIVDFRKDAPEGPPAEFRFTPEQIKNEMAEAGYTVDSEHDFLPRQVFLIFKV